MKIELTIIDKTKFEFSANLFEKLVNQIIKNELNENVLKRELTICIVFTQGEEIKILNQKYRGKNAKTDVLSFEGEYNKTGHVGDIIIDIEQAEEQKGNRSLNFEVQSLVIHGLLHLLGYEHTNERQKIGMQLKEKEFIKLIKE